MNRSSFPELCQGVNLDKTLDALIDAEKERHELEKGSPKTAETKSKCPGRYDPNAGVVGDSVDLSVFEKAGQKTLEVGRETLAEATTTGRFSRGYEQIGSGLPTALALTVHRDLQELKERVVVLEEKVDYLSGRLALYE
jgi:hypothetical protein